MDISGVCFATWSQAVYDTVLMIFLHARSFGAKGQLMIYPGGNPVNGETLRCLFTRESKAI